MYHLSKGQCQKQKEVSHGYPASDVAGLQQALARPTAQRIEQAKASLLRLVWLHPVDLRVVHVKVLHPAFYTDQTYACCSARAVGKLSVPYYGKTKLQLHQLVVNTCKKVQLERERIFGMNWLLDFKQYSEMWTSPCTSRNML